MHTHVEKEGIFICLHVAERRHLYCGDWRTRQPKAERTHWTWLQLLLL